MSLIFQNNIFSIQSFVSQDVDHLSEIAKPWNLELKKIDRNPIFFSKIDQIIAKDFLIMRTDFSSTLEQHGAPPGGMRTFWIPVDNDQYIYLRKNIITGNSFGFFPLGAELDAVSKPGFKVCVISIPEHILTEKASNLGLDWTILDRNGSKEHIILEYYQINLIREKIGQLYCLPQSLTCSEKRNLAFESLKNELIELLVLNCLHISESKISENPNNKLRIFKKFKEYLYSHPSESIRSEELCKYTGTSERTLQYIMKSFTGVSPQQYIKSYKLHLIRKNLQNGDSKNIRINNLAYEYGFWHTSQFAADYRKLFGELPSETLRK